MFQSMTTFCSYCGKFSQLHEGGACPHCSAYCAPYEGLVAACRDFQQKIDFLLTKFAFYMGTLSFRAEYEMDKIWMELRSEIIDQLQDWGEATFTLKKRLPKLDVTAIEFCHEKGERVAIYYEGYSGSFFHSYYKGREISFYEVVHDSLLQPVFPNVYAEKMSILEFHHLVPALYSCLTWNRLWYAALAEGFFVLPDISDLPPLSTE